MLYALKVITPPAIEPVTLVQAKEHLRVSIDTDDDLITLYIQAAREWCEEYTRRAFISQQLQWAQDNFPYFDSLYTAQQSYPPTGAYGPARYASTLWNHTQQILLPKAPLISVDAINYTAADGTPTLLDPSKYTVDNTDEPGRIFPVFGGYWPATQYSPAAVKIQFTAGYGPDATSVPAGIKVAILQLVASQYEYREPVVVGQTPAKMPLTLTALLDNYRNYLFGFEGF